MESFYGARQTSIIDGRAGDEEELCNKKAITLGRNPLP